MPALDFFEGIERDRQHIERLKQDMADLDSRIGPKAQGFEPTVRGGGGADRMLGLALVAMKLDELRAEMPNLERRLEQRIERATDVLYGRSGRGGLAKATCTDDADMLRFHYLQGETWASIARRYEPETTNLTVWCKHRAKWSCRQIDRIGMDVLADS